MKFVHIFLWLTVHGFSNLSEPDDWHLQQKPIDLISELGYEIDPVSNLLAEY